MVPNPPIVIVAFNRERSLKRLLNSIAAANYPNTNIDLIISIDYAPNNQNILSIANDFQWNYGKKIIQYQEKNLGLRKHILQCGNLSLKYGSVIVLEDDLFVSINYYNYACSALLFSEKNEHIGGVSLYNHQLNVHTKANFAAVEDGYDNWYFQFASSWGQAWTKKQWKDFMDWYQQNPKIDKISKVPKNVRNWSEKSWLKYNIAYLIAFKKYFLYPKISLTTNFSDAGTHIGTDSTVYQVPLLNCPKTDYIFSSVTQSDSVYDSFYENIALPKLLDLDFHKTTVDLHGYREEHQKYWLTPKIMNFKVVASYAKSLKPIDANIIRKIKGTEIFLYDTEVEVRNTVKCNKARNIIYNYKGISLPNALAIYKHHWVRRFRRLLRFTD